MKPFTRSELTSILVIFAVLAVISIPNFVVSLRRARDQTRKDDLGSLVYALDSYYEDFGEFPPAAPGGRIMACKKPGDKAVKNEKGKFVVNITPCDWGKDSLADLSEESGKVYMKILPRDPQFDKGVTYIYFSNKARYQIYASLEVENQPENDPKVVARKISCGTRICNLGRSFEQTPVDISIEQYEQQLLLERQKNEKK